MPLATRQLDDLGQSTSWTAVDMAPGSPFSSAQVVTGPDVPPTVPFDVDVSNYEGAVVYIDGTGAGLSFIFEWSLDGSVWLSSYGVPVGGSNLATFGTAMPAAVCTTGERFKAFLFPLGHARRFRVRLRLQSSGTTVFVVGLLSQKPEGLTSSTLVNGAAGDAASIAGNPVRIGARAVTSSPTVLTTGQTADLLATLDRRLIVLANCIPENSWSYAAATGGIVNTTGVTIKASAGAGLRNYLSTLHAKNTHATVATELTINDGASGTALWRGNLPAAMLTGDHIRFDPPLRGTAATLLEAKCVTTGAAVFVNATGWIAP